MKFTPFPIIKTDRLILRQLATTDSEVVLFLRSDASVNQYIKRPTPQNEADAQAFIQKIKTAFAADISIYWAISLQGNSNMIGSICLWNFSWERATGEVGYDLHPDFQGKGIMSEALKAVLDFGFNTLNLRTIEAYTHRFNETSKQLLVKNGFQLLEGKVDSDNLDNVIFEKSR